MIKPWKHIARTELLSHPRIHIVEDTVELPNGQRTQYVREAPHTSCSVAIIAINSQNEILVQREYSYPPDEIMYQLPGGGAGSEEDVIAAANRELSEESGYTARDSRVLGAFYVNNRRSDRKQYVVLCRDLIEEKRPSDPEEFIESMWLPLPKLQQLITDGKITNMNMLAALQVLQTKQGSTPPTPPRLTLQPFSDIYINLWAR